MEKNCGRIYFSQAACLFRSLVQNHAFHDGNKRTALMTLIIFLSENGYYLHYNNQTELVRFALRVAKHKQVQVSTIKEWVRKKARKTIDKDKANKKTWFLIKNFNNIVDLMTTAKEKQNTNE